MLQTQPNFAVSVELQGPASTSIAKASFPLRYGTYSEIKTARYEFRFNLNGEIKFIRGLDINWPHPAEHLKRTDGNDWVYYTVGDKSGANGLISWLGEYYLPCLPYPSNSIWQVDYFSNPNIMNAFAAWSQLYADLYTMSKDALPLKTKHLVNLILENNDRVLYDRAQRLHTIIGGRVSVLPPDTRHVDYEVIPLVIADGCLYHCKFCCVKTAMQFKPRSKDNIIAQIKALKHFYGRNVSNMHALFLANHDALAAGKALILFSLDKAAEAFGFKNYHEGACRLFLFASVDSWLRSEKKLFDTLNDLCFYTTINIGFESLDPPTLSAIGKPLCPAKIRRAFEKMNDINAAYPNIEITGNFLMGSTLLPQHYQSMSELLENLPKSSYDKGAIYMSPIKGSPKRRELLPQFFKIKEQSRLPVYTYLIQRL